MQSLGRKQRIYFMVPKTLSYSSLWGYCGFWGLDFLNINIAGNVPALRGTMSMGNFPPKITLWNQNSSTWLKLKYSCISWNIKVACLNRLFILCRIKCFVEIRRVNLTILCFVISLTLFFIAASFQLSCVLDVFVTNLAQCEFLYILFLFHRKVEICMFNFIFPCKCNESDSVVPNMEPLDLFSEQFVY